MQDIFPALQDVLAARTVERAWSIYTDAMATAGFDRLMYGYTRFRTQNGYGDRKDLMVLTNHPGTYTDWFIEKAMFRDAPMMQWAAENVGAMSWSWIRDNQQFLTARQLELVQRNKAFGVVAGYTVAFQESHARHKAAIAITAKPGMTQAEVDEIWRQRGDVIEMLSHVFHLKLLSLPFQPSSRKLTPRQREVLEWVGDGKTAQDIATILGVSTAAVEKHLRRAREMLSAETTAQAVFKASVQNQIFILDTET